MKGFIRQKPALTLIAFLLLIVAVAIPLSQVLIHAHAANPSASNVEPQNVKGAFFSYPSNSGVFDATPSNTPVFTQGFPNLNFNPSKSMQKCSNNTGVDGNTRPFTEVYANTDGSCTNIVAQGNNQQAGVGSLFSFESEFTATFSLPRAGQLTFNLSVDDGWILSMGRNGQGDQPTYVSGPKNNPPPSGKGPFTGYPVVGAYNTASFAAPLTLNVNIPAAGTYPIELDYAECCGGGIALTMSNQFTPTATTFTPSNYAGYASLGSRTQPTTFSDVQGSWTVPSIKCNVHPLSSEMAVRTWVGLGGIDTTSLEKVGIGAQCNSHVQSQYFAFYQMDAANTETIYHLVKPGDSMHAEIQFLGNSKFLLKLSNFTQKWTFSLLQSKSGRVLDSAECFVEAPTKLSSGMLSLVDFGTIHFSNCQANGKSINNGPTTDRFIMVDGKGNVKAVPSKLNSSGNSFSVTQ